MYKILIVLFIVSIVLSCGGGSSDSTMPPVPEPPQATTIITNTSGVITGFGSVFINGVEYETGSSFITTDDDDNATESHLEIGMIVSLSGENNDDGQTGSANSIHYEAQLKGALDSIDLAANSLVVLGQTVLFDDLTSLDNVILVDLIPGDFLEISGFYNANGQLYASRIEKEDEITQLKIQGKIDGLDTNDKTLLLANLTIDYSNAQFEQFTEADLINGQMIRVKGEPISLIDDVFAISHIKLKEDDEDHDDGDKRHVEGIITSFDSSASFVVNDIHVVTNSDTEFEYGTIDSLTLNIRVKIKGTYDANGSLVADEIRIHQRTNLKIEGTIEGIDIDLSTITVLDVTFEVNDQTKMKDKSDSEERFFDLSDLFIGDFVEVRGFIDENGNKIATKLERENEIADMESELKGHVSNIVGFTFMVIDVQITTLESTEFDDVHGDVVTQTEFFEQLVDGMLVEVKGQIIEGEFIAHKVEIEEGNDDDEGNNRTEFRGVIEEILTDSLLVSNHLVIITSTTEFEVNDSTTSAEQFWQIVNVGDQIKVKGTIDEEGIISAKSIKLEIEHQQGVAEIEIWGVPFYSESTLTTLEHAIEFDQQTEFKGDDDELTFEQFIEQVTNWTGIEIEGVLRENIIFANKIEFSDDNEKFGDVKLKGHVESLIDNGLIIAEHTAIFDDNTQFKIGEQAVSLEEFLENLSDNSKIELSGKFQLDTNDDGSLNEDILVREIELN